MSRLRKHLLLFAIATIFCLPGACRRITPIADLWSNPRAWKGKRVAVHGLVSDHHVPEGKGWLSVTEEERGFQLTDTTGGNDDWVPILTDGAVPAEDM